MTPAVPAEVIRPLPQSESVWVRDPVDVPLGIYALGGSPEGWLQLSTIEEGWWGDLVVARRIGPGGRFIDPVAIDMLPCQDWYDAAVLWDGSSYVVVVPAGSGLFYPPYYYIPDPIGAAWIPASGLPIVDSTEIATFVGWPVDLAGGCDGLGNCDVVFTDYYSFEIGRWSFDASGGPATTGAVAVADTYVSGAVRDTDATVIVAAAGAPVSAVWLPDDESVPVEQLALATVRPTEIMGLAMGADGIALVVSSVQIQLPYLETRVVAQRFRRGELLDPTPIELAVSTLYAQFGVAFTGSSFAVGIDDAVEGGTRQLIRVGIDGTVSEPIDIADPDPTAELSTLIAGPPGHLVWRRRVCSEDDPETSWCDVRADSYRVLEVDVPDGGACSDSVVCTSGVCVDGICEAAP